MTVNESDELDALVAYLFAGAGLVLMLGYAVASFPWAVVGIVLGVICAPALSAFNVHFAWPLAMSLILGASFFVFAGGHLSNEFALFKNEFLAYGLTQPNFAAFQSHWTAIFMGSLPIASFVAGCILLYWQWMRPGGSGPTNPDKKSGDVTIINNSAQFR